MNRAIYLRNYVSFCSAAGMTLEDVVEETRREYVREAVRACNGRQSQAKELLGLHRTHISRLASKYGAKRSPHGGPKSASKSA